MEALCSAAFLCEQNQPKEYSTTPVIDNAVLSPAILHAPNIATGTTSAPIATRPLAPPTATVSNSACSASASSVPSDALFLNEIIQRAIDCCYYVTADATDGCHKQKQDAITHEVATIVRHDLTASADATVSTGPKDNCVVAYVECDTVVGPKNIPQTLKALVLLKRHEYQLCSLATGKGKIAPHRRILDVRIIGQVVTDPLMVQYLTHQFQLNCMLPIWVSMIIMCMAQQSCATLNVDENAYSTMRFPALSAEQLQQEHNKKCQQLEQQIYQLRVKYHSSKSREHTTLHAVV